MTHSFVRIVLILCTAIATTASADVAFGVFDDFGTALISLPVPTNPAAATGSAVNPWADPAVVGNANAATNLALANSPLVVTNGSHVVVMEYEAYFAPKGVNFQTSAGKPILKSASMAAAGLLGYDSSDPAVIKQHAAWIIGMHADAVWLDHSNNAPCTFNDVATGCDGNAGSRAHYTAIRSGNEKIYDEYARQKIPLKIIPLLDGQDDKLFDVDTAGTSATEKQIRYYKSLMDAHPNQQIIYYGKPLLTFYMGTPVKVANIAAVNNLLNVTGLQTQFTVRFVGGMLSNQATLYQVRSGREGLPQMKFGLWSFLETNIPSAGQRPTYTVSGDQVESFTAAVAFPGLDTWGSKEAPSQTAGFRGDGTTFRTFVNYAKALKPTFLFVNQFNEFHGVDQGFSADTTNDIEPADLWGTATMGWVTSALADYRKTVGGVPVSTATVGPAATAQAVEAARTTVAPNVVAPTARSAGLFRVGDGAGVYYSNGQGHYCGYPNLATFTESNLNFNDVVSVPSIADGLISDGACGATLKQGFFRVNDAAAIYRATGDGHYCVYRTPGEYAAAGGTAGNYRSLDGIPGGNAYDGPCVASAAPASPVPVTVPRAPVVEAASEVAVSSLPSATAPTAAPAMPAGFFRIGVGTPAVYAANGTGHFCAFANPADYLAAGGTRNQSNVRTVYAVPPSMINDGVCKR